MKRACFTAFFLGKSREILPISRDLDLMRPLPCLLCQNLQISWPFSPFSSLLPLLLTQIWIISLYIFCLHSNSPLLALLSMASGWPLRWPYCGGSADLGFWVICLLNFCTFLVLPVGLRPLSWFFKYGLLAGCAVSMTLLLHLSLSTVCSVLWHPSSLPSQVCSTPCWSRLCSLLY